MTHFLLKLWASVVVFMFIFASHVEAAPQKVLAEYEVSRKGQPFAKVTETFTQREGKYQIESVTKGIGVYALLGVRKLTSYGEVTEQGLRPLHFELHQGDNEKKSLYADFDWQKKQLSLKVKGKESIVALEEGAQDLASYPYQWMFVAPLGEQITLPVTTGKKLRTYQYRIIAKDESVISKAGEFKTLHLVDASQPNSAAEATKTDEQKQLWLASNQQYLVVRMQMQDENGFLIEQILSHLELE